MTRTALILGPSGKIGTHMADALWNAGWRIRPFVRGTDMVAAAKGCDLIVNGLNPPNYHDWARIIPRTTAQVIAAAQSSGATVLIPGNVYNLGTEPGPWTTGTPHRPTTRKGRIRAEMEAAYRASGVRTIVLRAGNFIDPNRNADVLSLFVLRSVASGRVVHGGDPDARLAWAYLPDWARAATGLVEMADRLPRFADIPFAGHTASVRDIANAVAQVTGRATRLSAFPWWMMRLASPVWELARELLEMRYLWTMAHSLDPAPLAALLPDLASTPLVKAIAASLPPEVHPDQPVRAGRLHVAAE